MRQLRQIEPYSDDDGNVVDYSGPKINKAVKIQFHGSNNRLEIAEGAKIAHLVVFFKGDNARVTIGPTVAKRSGLRFTIRVGHESSVSIGKNVGCTARTFVTASEGADVAIGEDCMIATDVEIRADDAHAIYDVRSGKRTNASRSIEIGDHVWLAKSAAVMGGVTIGSGSVIGFRSVVTRNVPNNCVAAGAPARVVRRNIAWERPSLAWQTPDSLTRGPASRSESYWNLTDDDGPVLTKSTDRTKPPRWLRWKRRIRKVSPQWAIDLRRRIIS